MAGKVFVSGADKGLGFSLTNKFLKSGFQVFAGAYKPSSDFSSLIKEFPKMLTVVPIDVTDMDSVRRAAQQVAKKVSSVDILINNAAVYLESKTMSLEEIDLSDKYLAGTMDVNTFGPLRVTQQFLPLLEKGLSKMIINISSEAGSIKDCRRNKEFAYCMSKTALNMQSKLLQNYLGPKGFKILTVHPGWMRTEMGGKEADISPDESAEGIFKLATKKWQTDDVIYIDYKGNPLNW